MRLIWINMSRIVLALMCFLSLIFISCAGHTNELSLEHKFLQSVTTKFIHPAHQALEESIGVLEKNSRQFCQNINQQTYLSLRASWVLAMSTWSAIAPINFGPIDDSNAAWRFQFWPDQINLVHRKFKSRIKGYNKAILAEDLAAASVAIQGLSAIEYLLFDKIVTLEAYQTKPHLCSVLIATAKNLLSNATKLTASWIGEYPQRWFKFADAISQTSQTSQTSQPGYLLRQVESVFSGLVMALGSIQGQKLAKPLGYKKNKTGTETTRGKLNPWLLESWRSQTSLEQINNTLKNGLKLYTTEQSLSDYLISKDEKNQVLDRDIRQYFSTSITLVESFETSAFQDLKNNNSAQLENLYKHVQGLYRLLKIDYAKAANIHFRFNAQDGD